jgi:plasmid stabilization system protein ParE
MAKLKWTEQALNDVEAIAIYIARDSFFYAQAFAQRIFDSVQRLEIFPESGRLVPEVAQQNIREVLHGNYRVIYRVKNDFVEILTVYHSSRLLDKNSIA